MKCVALSLLLLVSGAAFADPVDPGVMEDANAGHVWLMPTALVPAEGTWSIDGQELFGLGASYAFSDRVIGSVTTAYVPLGHDSLEMLAASVKVQVVHSSNLRVALVGAAMAARDNEHQDEGGTQAYDTTALYGAGVATFCFDADCSSHFDTAISVLHTSESSDDNTPVVFGAALVAGVSPVKLLLEADAVDVFRSERVNLAIAGVRLAFRHGGLDVGWAACVGSHNCGNGPGVPVVQYAARF